MYFIYIIYAIIQNRHVIGLEGMRLDVLVNVLKISSKN